LLLALPLLGLLLPLTSCEAPASLSSIQVSPATQSIAAGATAQFTATGTYTHGSHPAQTEDITSQVSWSSSAASIGTVSASGLAKGVAAGSATITAQLNGISGSGALTVTAVVAPEPLVSLAIVPETQTATTLDQTVQFIAIGTTSSGATVDLTNQTATIGTATIAAATWSSSSAAVASINAATGLGMALTTGATTISAITKNPDGTVVTGTAAFTVNIAVSEPLLAMTVVPGTQTVASAGQSSQFLAIGTFAASSSTPGNQNMANESGYTVQWSSSNPQVATVNASTGLATAVGVGATAITAVATNNTDKSGATASATLTVTGPAAEPVSALSIFPGSQSVTLAAVGAPSRTVQFIAIGTNGTTSLQTNVSSQVAWSSSNPQAVSIGSSGLATVLGAGTVTLTAIATNPDNSLVTATATLTVLNVTEPLQSMVILPNAQIVASPGQTSQLQAIGTFSTAPFTQNLTSDAPASSYPIKWSSSNTAVATVGSPEKAGTTPGLVTAMGQGTAAITAIASNSDGTLVTAPASFTVVNSITEPITALTIVPNSQTLAALDQTARFIALGTSGSTGLQTDMTSQVTWTATVPSVANIVTGQPAGSGVATSSNAGSTSITAVYTNPDHSVVSATPASLTVTVSAAPEPVLSINILPNTCSVFNILDTCQFLAIGTGNTTPTVTDVTDSVVWTTSNPDFFPINTSGSKGGQQPLQSNAQAGLATAEAVGTAVVIAEFTNTDGTVVTGTATFTCPYGECSSAAQQPLLSTLTIFNAGQNTTSWEITAPSNTGTANLIHCGPGSGAGNSVCVATYPVGTTVTLTASPFNGSFGGWSANCDATQGVPDTAATCTLTLTTNETVGAIFN